MQFYWETSFKTAKTSLLRNHSNSVGHTTCTSINYFGYHAPSELGKKVVALASVVLLTSSSLEIAHPRLIRLIRFRKPH